MVDISFEINGKIVQPDDMTDALDILFLKHIREKTNDSLASTCCPAHGEKPSIIVRGQTIDNLNFEVSGCCDDLINKVNKQLNKRG